MIKVLHMVHKFYPIISGTSERVFHSQPTDGVEHHIIVPSYDNRCSNYRYEEGFMVYQVRLERRLPGRLSVNPRVNVLFKKAMGIIEDKGIDIIYGHNPQVFAAAALKVKNRVPAIPLIYEPHSLLHTDYETSLGKGSFMTPRFLLHHYFKYITDTERDILAKADRVVCQTEAIKQAMMELYGMNPEKGVIGYNGIPDVPQAIDVPRIRRQYDLPNGSVVFYGGHLSANNGVDTIIRLVELMPDVTFVIAGKGEFEAQLSQMDRACQNLKFLGPLSKDEFLKVAAASDVLVFLREPNLTNDSFLALKILDAIGLNKWILSSRLKIMQEVLQHYRNIVFTDFGIGPIVESLRLACTQSEERRNIQGASLPEAFRWATTRGTMRSMYEDLVGKDLGPISQKEALPRANAATS